VAQVTVLRTPPPSALHHLCITADNIAQVIPVADARAVETTLGAPDLQRPMLTFDHHGAGAGQLPLAAPPPPALLALQEQQRADMRAPPETEPRLHSPPPQRVLADRPTPSNLLLPAAHHASKHAAPPQPPPACLPDGIDDLLAGLDEEFAL
jgi:hypothetical protein